MHLKHLPTIHLRTIPQNRQRYSTCGDYWINKNGDWEMRVSELRPEYELAIAIHELFEFLDTQMRGISEEEIIKFDTKTVFEVDPKNSDDPGLSLFAPYHQSHMKADKLERLVIKLFGLKWKDYCDDIDNYLNKMEIKLEHDGCCTCPNCGGNAAYILTRVTGYFGKTSMFNAGKIGEMRNRHRTTNKYWKKEGTEINPVP